MLNSDITAWHEVMEVVSYHFYTPDLIQLEVRVARNLNIH